MSEYFILNEDSHSNLVYISMTRGVIIYSFTSSSECSGYTKEVFDSANYQGEIDFIRSHYRKIEGAEFFFLLKHYVIKYALIEYEFLQTYKQISKRNEDTLCNSRGKKHK